MLIISVSGSPTVITRMYKYCALTHNRIWNCNCKFKFCCGTSVNVILTISSNNQDLNGTNVTVRWPLQAFPGILVIVCTRQPKTQTKIPLDLHIQYVTYKFHVFQTLDKGFYALWYF
jgi:hypothetical protein